MIHLHYRWIEKKSDEELFNWVKICALLHGQIVVFGNIKEDSISNFKDSIEDLSF